MLETEAAFTGGSREEDCVVMLGCVGGKGGQGTSMFSAGLSGLLSREKQTILVDLDLNSTHRHLLERDNCPGISNLATVIGEISLLSLGNIIQRHPLGFDVLPGLRVPEEASLLNQVNLNLIFNLLSGSYKYIVLDLHADHRLLALGLLARCSLVFLVVHPDLLSLRCALRTMETCGRSAAGPAHWGLVVNGSSSGGLIQPCQASSVLGIPLLAVLPEDPAAAEDFSNFMRPGPGDGPFHAAIARMTTRMKLTEGSTSTVNKGLSARCLRALRAWSGGRREPGRPRAGLPGTERGSPCAR